MKTAFIVLIAIHLLACAVWFYFIMGLKKDALVLLIPVIFLPIIGLLSAWISIRKIQEEKETPVSKLYRLSDKEIAPVSAGRPELDTVLPFDEVLLLTNDQSRREVMMHFLRRDPFMYLEMLKVAKVSTDVEITHYATTTIMEIQRDLDIAMQKAEKAYFENPDDLEPVNRFIQTLISYIDTGLLLENRMVQLRHQLSEVLEHKLAIFENSRSAHLLLVENEIQLGNYGRASEVSKAMCEKWPTHEDSWLMGLHVCMVSGNAVDKAAISEKIKTIPISWSRAGREEVEFLCGSIN